MEKNDLKVMPKYNKNTSVQYLSLIIRRTVNVVKLPFITKLVFDVDKLLVLLLPHNDPITVRLIIRDK